MRCKVCTSACSSRWFVCSLCCQCPGAFWDLIRLEIGDMHDRWQGVLLKTSKRDMLIIIDSFFFPSSLSFVANYFNIFLHRRCWMEHTSLYCCSSAWWCLYFLRNAWKLNRSPLLFCFSSRQKANNTYYRRDVKWHGQTLWPYWFTVLSLNLKRCHPDTSLLERGLYREVFYFLY